MSKRTRLTEKDVLEIKMLLSGNCLKNEIAYLFEVSYWTIWSIATGKTWKHVVYSFSRFMSLCSEEEKLEYSYE